LLRIPDAHVNYIDATDIFKTYGVTKSSIFLIRNSPDTDKLFQCKKELIAQGVSNKYNSLRVVHVGRLVEWKKTDCLIRAFSIVVKTHPDAKLIVVGDGPEKDKLEDLCHELKIESSVEFVGAIHDAFNLGRYLMSSSLYVLAGMGGLSINDAMVFGLPVV
jgi:glycosyltransferase involved in cell wall biosynthesis